MNHKVVVGLEVNAQLLTRSKMICSCKEGSFRCDANIGLHLLDREESFPMVQVKKRWINCQRDERLGRGTGHGSVYEN